MRSYRANCGSGRLSRVLSWFEIPWCLSLGMDANLWIGTATFMATKRYIADDAIPTDPPALKQQGKRVVGDLPARARQAHMGISVHDFPDCSCAPVVVGLGIMGRNLSPLPAAGEGARRLPCPLCLRSR